MPSFTSRHYTPERFRSLSKPGDNNDGDDLMEDIAHAHSPHSAHSNFKANSHLSSALTLVPSDGSLLDYFDLPSPPSTPHRATTHSYSSLNSFPSPTTSPGLVRSTSTSRSSSRTSSPSTTPPTSSPPSWPTTSQRMQHHHRLPSRPRSRSVSSSSSSSSGTSSATLADMDLAMGGMGTSASNSTAPLIRSARRTPYYPPNSSRNQDRTRVFMNRGPHYIPNWTPLSSLPRHVQLQIEERMVRFTAI